MQLKNKQTSIREDQLETIKQRVKTATPGLWLLSSDDNRNIGTLKGDVIAVATTEEDARFIARSKYVIMKLIAEIEQLQGKESDALTAEVEQMSWDEILGRDEDAE